MRTALRAALVWAIAGACLVALLFFVRFLCDGWIGDFRELAWLVLVFALLTGATRLEPLVRRWIK